MTSATSTGATSSTALFPAVSRLLHWLMAAMILAMPRRRASGGRP